jgi:hypothetical protein
MSLSATIGRDGQALGARLGSVFEVNESNKVVTIGDASAAVQQISTVTVDTAQNSTVYNLTLRVPAMSLPVTVSYTSDGTATTTEIATNLTAAIVADSVTNGLVAATSSTNVITLTARRPNQVVTIASSAASSGDLTIATGTAAAAGGSYTFGRYINLSSYNATKARWSVSAATLPSAATLTLVATHDASATYVAKPIFANAHTGATSSPNLTWAAGANATAMAALADTAIEAAISGSSVATAVDGDDVTIVVTLPWPQQFSAYSLDPAASGGGGSEALVHSASTSIGAAPRSGIVMDYGVTPPPAFGTSATATQAGDDVSAFEAGGMVWVTDPGATVTAGGAVYIETTAGATNGRAYTTSSTTRYIEPNAKWVRGGVYIADGTLAALIEQE